MRPMKENTSIKSAINRISPASIIAIMMLLLGGIGVLAIGELLNAKEYLNAIALCSVLGMALPEYWRLIRTLSNPKHSQEDEDTDR